MVVISSDVQRAGSVEVLGRIVEDVGDEAVDVVDGERGSGVASLDVQLVRDLVGEQAVH